MGQVIEMPEIDLVEPIPVPLVYAEGVARAVIIGDRIHLVSYDDIIGADGHIEHHIVERTAWKIDMMKNAMPLIASAILEHERQRIQTRPDPTEMALLM